MKKYELKVPVQEIVELTAVVVRLDPTGDVQLRLGQGCTFLVHKELAFKLGLLREVRNHQIGDVYLDRSGWKREIVHLSEENVYYSATAPTGRVDPNGAEITDIENWGELQ